MPKLDALIKTLAAQLGIDKAQRIRNHPDIGLLLPQTPPSSAAAWVSPVHLIGDLSTAPVLHCLLSLLSLLNEALKHLVSGKARYRIVLKR
jgi:hypothetical protein